MRYFLLTFALSMLCTNMSFAQFGPTRPGGVGGGIGSAPATGGGGFGGGFGNIFGTGVSPYLSLVGSRTVGLNAATSYGIFRQQTDLRSSLQSLQQQVYVGGASSGTGIEEALQGITIGTKVRFLNTGNYFQSLGGTTILPGGGLVSPVNQGSGVGTGSSSANPGFGTGGVRPAGGAGAGGGAARPRN